MKRNPPLQASDFVAHLTLCGYSGNLIRQDFSFGRESVPVAGFADETYDARSACIAVLDAPASAEAEVQQLVDACRPLGAPVAFVCHAKHLQWWQSTSKGAHFQEQVPANKIAGFLSEHREKFSPQKIYRAKTIEKLNPDGQLSFVDAGLLPLLENEMGGQVAKLIHRMSAAAKEKASMSAPSSERAQRLFRSVFWLLAGRILKDKEVEDFVDLDIEDVVEALQRVNRHYHADHLFAGVSGREKNSLQAAAHILNRHGSLRNLTIEALAHVYENVLIDKEIRSKLGVHATPSYLVDYIVWQLFDRIREIPVDKRTVLEPACGHAPFLVSAARLLRELVDFRGSRRIHNYLRKHLVGVETDDFAREIARLSLTLADVPNPNGWNLVQTDMFRDNTLSGLAKKSTILLCNPPFEDFSAEERSAYNQDGNKLDFKNKAAELLWRTLPHMPAGSVFGVIVPQGFLHSSNAAKLRQLILEQYDVETIMALPETVFARARHLSAVILGRKRRRSCGRPTSSKTRYAHVRKWDLPGFKERYQAATELLDQSRFLAKPDSDLRWQQLDEVWEYCQALPNLATMADIGKGLEYKGKELPPGAATISKSKFKGAVRGYAEYDKDVKIIESPRCSWMNLDRRVIRRAQRGLPPRTGQVIMNYVRVSLGPWRLKAFIDREGRPVISNFLVVRPIDQTWSLEALWAILNSPFANAYAYCHSMGKHNLAGMVRKIPVPEADSESTSALKNLVERYFALYSPGQEFMQQQIDANEAKQRMLAIDAEVMRLYDLPPRLERQVLDLFNGWQRKGVDFDFERYFPGDFESWIPLHEYLSEDYQRSTPEYVQRWVDESRCPELIEALRVATEAFRED